MNSICEQVRRKWTTSARREPSPVHARKKFTETFERYESLETCLKRFFNEALHGSDSVCKGSNPYTAAIKKELIFSSSACRKSQIINFDTLM